MPGLPSPVPVIGSVPGVRVGSVTGGVPTTGGVAGAGGVATTGATVGSVAAKDWVASEVP